MKKSFVKELAVLVVLTVLGRTMPAYGGWQQQDRFWQYEKDGTWLKSDWVHDLGDWYHLDADGVMETGWKQIGGFWYFLNPVSDGTCGRMLTGWQWIDGKCYCLAQEDSLTHPKGAMYANRQTPDGYWVDETGAWVDERGEVVEIPGKGILTDRSEKVKLSGTAKRGLGNGGGSGSRSGGGGSRSGSESKSGNGSKSGSSESGNRNEERESEGEKESGMGEKYGNGDEGGEKNGNGDIISQEDNRESEDGSDCTWTEKTEEPATASNAAQVNWYVHFVDKSTHQALLAETRQGKIQDGERLVLNFRNRIVDQENRLWESVEQPPLDLEVYGPGDWIYYVEYVQTEEQREPEDIFEEDRVRLRSWLDTGKRQESTVTGEDISDIPDTRFLVGDQKDADGRLLTIAGQIPSLGEYSVYLIGKNHEPEGRVLKNYFGDGIVYSKLVEDRFSLEGDVYTVVRFSLKRSQGQDREDWDQEEKTDFENSWEKLHWNIGDVLTGEIDGEMYNFRCIDQNYSDLAGNHREGALFFCDSVIPADIGSSYIYEPIEDGGYEYVFYPGPVVNFGKKNDYKYSNVHMWLQNWEENFIKAKDIDIGISRAYTGSTGDGMYSRLKASELKGYPIGNQKLTGKLFALSVDEALKYRDWLWKFDGSEEENPESQTGMFSKGYWLRNPMGTTQNHDTGFVYAVDLEGGKICPVKIGPEKSAEDEELQVTGVIGVRPAFVMPLQ